MNDNPWIKLYPGDWRNNLALQSCSLAARGLWVEMLCIMRGAPREGYLTANCKPISIERLAALVSAEAPEIVRLVAELEAAGVAKRIDDCIVSKRMIRWSKKVADGHEHGIKAVQGTRNDAPPGVKPPGVNGSGSDGSESGSGSGPGSSGKQEAQREKGSAEGKGETPKKSKVERKPATGPHAEVIQAFEAAFLKARGAPYAFVAGKDGSSVKKLLEFTGGDSRAVIDRIPLLFADRWWGPKASLSNFVAAWNSLTPPVKPKTEAESLFEYTAMRRRQEAEAREKAKIAWAEHEAKNGKAEKGVLP